MFAYLDYPEGIALDGAGNLYIADQSTSRIRKVTATAWGVWFSNTYVGSQGQGFPFAAASNIGNTALNLTSVATAGPDFTVSQSGNCFSLASLASSPVAVSQVAVGDTCLPIPVFAPTLAGNLTDNMVFTDDSLNVSGATQQVPLSGTALLQSADHHLHQSRHANPGRCADHAFGLVRLRIAGDPEYRLRPRITEQQHAHDYRRRHNRGAGGPGGQQCYSAASSVQATFQVNPSVLTANVGSTSTSEGINFVLASGGTGIHVQVVTTGISNLYFKDAGTGTCNTNGAAHTYSVGGSCTVVVDFQPAYPGQFVGAVRLIDSTGAAVATQMISGKSTSAELVAWPGVLSTVAGTGNRGYFGDGGAAISANLRYPGNTAVDAAGNLYIADYGNNAIRRVDATTQTITTVAGNGDGGYSGDNGPAIQASLNSPWWVSIDGAGNLYIADTSNNVIRKVDAVTQTITTVAGNGTRNYGGDGGLATSAQLNNPQTVVVDASGNLYISDTSNNRVRKVDAATQNISTVAGNGTAGYSGDGGLATSAELAGLWTIALDGAGNLYIVDDEDSVIRKVDASTQKITTVAGNGNSGYSGDGGPATGAALNVPSAVAVDAAGNMYIADYYNNLIRKVDAATQTIFSVAGSGYCQSTTDPCGDGGSALEGDFNGPTSVTLDGAGNLYIADDENNRIRKVSAAAASVSFPSTYVTQQSSSQDVFASNIGNATLSLASVAPSSADFGLTAYGNCQSTTQLNAGASCTTSVDFTPTMAGNLSTYLVFTDNALNVTSSTQQVALTGTATKQPQTINFTNPGTQTYGAMPFGLTASATSGLPVTFSVVSGPATLNGNTLTITGAGTVYLEANQAGNYAWAVAPAVDINFTVQKATASVTPIAAHKTYGTADPTLTGNLAGFVASDNVTASYSRTAGETVAGSPYTISATLNASAAVLANYSITYQTSAFTINQATASVTPNAVGKTYGTADPTLTGALTGFVASDNVTASYSRTSGETVAGGPYTISATLNASAAVLANYSITYYSAQFNITQAPASVTPNAAGKTYGTTDPTLTGALAGFVTADNVTASYSRTSGETVAGGPYSISATLNASAAVLANYSITYHTAQFTISKAPASITPSIASKTYGTADPTFTGTLSGFLASDNVTASYSRIAGETVAGGPYAISATLSPSSVLGNYTITYNTAQFTINKATASVTPSASSKAYGTADPAFGGILSGFLAADTVTASYGRTTGETVAGSPYTISATLSPSSVLGNYTITYNTGQFTINKATASVTPGGASKTYGMADPTFTGTLSGFLAADNVTASYSRTTGETVAGGPYTISATLSPSSVLGNYTITYNTAQFVISKATASVTPNNLGKS